MSRIIISERQLRVLETLLKEEGVMLDNGSLEEYGNSSEIGTSCPIDDADGNPERGEDVYADEISKMDAYQGYGGNTRGKVY